MTHRLKPFTVLFFPLNVFNMRIYAMHSGSYALGREGVSESGLILTGMHHLLILTFYCKKPALYDGSFLR